MDKAILQMFAIVFTNIICPLLVEYIKNSLKDK